MDKSISINLCTIVFFIIYIFVLDQMKNENIELMINLYRRSFIAHDWKLEYLLKNNAQDTICYLKDNRFKIAFLIAISIVIIVQTLIVS